MSEKTVEMYDGQVIKKVVLEEVEEDTSYYTKISEQQITRYGIFLDVQANYEQLKSDVEKLYKPGFQANYLLLFTDYGHRIFLVSRFVRGEVQSKIPSTSSWFDWLIDRLLELGYVNHPYEIETDPRSIKFVITPKEADQTPFEMHFIPMDEHCYLFKEERST